MPSPSSSSSSRPDCPPRFGTPRSDCFTHGADLAVFAEALGTPLMPWQRHVADVALEVDPVTGLLRYRQVVLTVPRQSGKTAFLLALIMWRALTPKLGGRQQVAFTAQTALDARDRLQNEWEPKLAASRMGKTYRPSWKTGKESLFFTNGSRLQIVASTEKGGHGATLDLPIIDEAFAQPDNRLEVALSPTMLTRPQPQMWVVSTAGKTSDSWFARQVAAGRRAAVSPSSLTAFFEWSAAEQDDAEDPATWWRCMPALGHTITEAAVRAELEKALTDEREGFGGFVRTMLNRPPDVGRTSAALDVTAWQDLAEPADPTGGVTIAVSADPGLEYSAVAVGFRRPDGLPHVALVAWEPGTAWVAAEVAKQRRRLGGRVLVDVPLRGLVKGEEVTPSQVAQAHNRLAELVQDGAVRHDGDGPLNVAVGASRWRPVGDSRVLVRRGSTDVTPLLAAALAVDVRKPAPAPRVAAASMSTSAASETSFLSGAAF